MHYWMVFWNVLPAWNIIKSYFAMLLPCCFTDMTGFKAGDQCESWIQIWKLKSKFSFIGLVGYNLMITCSKKVKICTRNFFWVEKKKNPGSCWKISMQLEHKNSHHLATVWYPLSYQDSSIQSTLSKTDTFGTGPVSVLERSPSYRESR